MTSDVLIHHSPKNKDPIVNAISNIKIILVLKFWKHIKTLQNSFSLSKLDVLIKNFKIKCWFIAFFLIKLCEIVNNFIDFSFSYKSSTNFLKHQTSFRKGFNPQNYLVAMIGVQKLFRSRGWICCVTYWSVKIRNNSYSLWSLIKYGVPQGSILDPILFSIFLCDMLFLVDSVDVASYADDNTYPLHFQKKQIWS